MIHLDERQLVLDVGARAASFGREAFVEGPCNSAALTDITRVGAWSGQPRLLIGPPRSGKTHLAHVFAARTGARRSAARQLSAADMASEAPAVVLEDAHRLRGDPRRQELAFHLFNACRASGRALLITGRGTPRGWGIALPDLESRLSASPQLVLQAPDQATLRMILIKLFSDRQLAVPPETVDYTVLRMERSFEAAYRLVAALDEISLTHNRPITKPMIRDVLDQVSRQDPVKGGPE